MARTWLFLPSTISRCLLRNQPGILSAQCQYFDTRHGEVVRVHCRGFWMMVTRRSSSSEVRSPARLLRSTSAFLQTKLEYRRPTPVILVRAYMTFCLPSTFVFNKRIMYWKLWRVSIVSYNCRHIVEPDALTFMASCSTSNSQPPPFQLFK